MVSLSHFEQYDIPTSKGILQIKVTLALLNKIAIGSLFGALISLLVASVSGSIVSKSCGAVGMFGLGLVGYASSRKTEALLPATQAKEALDNQLIDELATHDFVCQTSRLIQFQQQPVYANPPQVVAGENLNFYDWEDLEDEAVGIVIAGQSGSGKTSVACWVLGQLTRNKPAIIKVCDPHYNDLWEEIGLTHIGEFNEIQSELEWLVAELDRRRIRKKNKEPLGENLIVVADEIGACIESFEDPKIITRALKRIGSEGRKFGIILIAIDQSPNAEDLGISAKKRDNYLMIGLCSVAVALAEQKHRQDHPTMQALVNVPYPCVVKLGGILTPAIHPTHHDYPKFKKQGNPPRNLMPINQVQPEVKEPVTEPVAVAVDLLNRCYGMASVPVATTECCPHCDSQKIKWLSKNANRKQCNNCGKSWTIK